jgi:hypothetical protein
MDASDPKHDFFVGRKGERQGTAVQVHKTVYRDFARNFLYIAFWKYNIVIFLKHPASRPSIMCKGAIMQYYSAGTSKPLP